MPLNIYVCAQCLDVPQQQLRAIVLPADPVPIVQPRTENFDADETNYQVVTEPSTTDPATGIPIPGTTTLLTESGDALTTQAIGSPVGLVQPAVQPLYQTTAYGVQIYPTSVSSVGGAQVVVTTSPPHGLSNGDIVSIEGLSLAGACGFFSVNVATATTFTYGTNTAIASGALLTSTTRIVTALVGLPIGFDNLPMTGV